MRGDERTAVMQLHETALRSLGEGPGRDENALVRSAGKAPRNSRTFSGPTVPEYFLAWK